MGIAAGVFILMGLAMFMHAFAWLLDDIFFGDNIWIGFAIESLFWFVIAGVAGLVAYRSFQAGAPPVPELAIEEARRTKETLTGEQPMTGPATESTRPGGSRERGGDRGLPQRRRRAGGARGRRGSGAQLGADPPATSSSSARSSVARSRPFAAAWRSSPTGAARCASTGAS